MIGLLILLVTTLSASPPPGAPALPTNNGYTQLQTQLEAGPPTFVNPFESSGSASLTPFENGSVNVLGTWFFIEPAAVYNNASVSACSSVHDYWGCVSTEDGAGSYVYLNSVHKQFDVNMTPSVTLPQFLLSSIAVTYQCKAFNIDSGVEFLMYLNDGSTLNFDVNAIQPCAVGDFVTYTYTDQLSTPHNATEFNPPVPVGMSVNATGGAVEVSYLKVSLSWVARQWCAGGLDGISCNFFNAIRTVGDGIMFLVNGAIYLGGLAVWTVTLAYDFMSGVVGSFIWVLTIPGTPSVVQGILVAAMVALMGGIVFIIVSRVRGVGNLG